MVQLLFEIAVSWTDLLGRVRVRRSEAGDYTDLETVEERRDGSLYNCNTVATIAVANRSTKLAPDLPFFERNGDGKPQDSEPLPPHSVLKMGLRLRT
ncbi:hypothetical protein CR513_43708, partial [Mucuna pruriens]